MKKYRGMRIAAVSLALILAGTVSSLRTVRASETDAQTAVYLVVGEEEQNEHSGTDAGEDRTSEQKNVQTGDTGNVLIWTAAAGGSRAVCIAAARKKQRI